ncbi:hypothetical protein BD311DRAFT_759734 [Dichomitus squalens]|uniref:DUF6534 domain-containing protein n=1 Tax=Dichomitus squalens TaxID=114155 RepID=A0A4Q9MJU1_9APHY|nr:hypothetical protein BD311DRAFT_759734 [Dichomitus squalens]
MSANVTAMAPAVPALDNSFGAILIGTFIGLTMYGLSLNQMFRYFHAYPGDTFILKGTVLCLSILDTFHSIACMHASYHYLVNNYFRPQVLLVGVWSVRILAPVTGVTVLVAQSFYARRIYRLGSGYALVVIPIALFMLGTAGFTIAASYEIFAQATFAKFEHFTWLMSGGFACSLATDVVLAVTLIVFLMRSRTAFKKTNSMLSVLVVYTINTGLLTSALSLASLAFGLSHPENMIYIAVNMLATKSYVNAVLAVVNSRRGVAESTRETGGFGTFGLTAQQQLSQRVPARMDTFRASAVQRDVIDVHWNIPPEDDVPMKNHGVESKRDGDVV